MIASVIRPIDRESLRAEYAGATPFPFFKIDNFLDEDFAQSVVAAYPTYDNARKLGLEFDKVNERLKIQITDSTKFPAPVAQLAQALSSEEWLGELEHITDIPKLLADAEFNGGGMHMTGPGGRLDVHVDFNYVPQHSLHRRLNILLYLNPVWEDTWGGNIELWDKSVRQCCQSFKPAFNRCVVFETSELSYHGVTPVKAPAHYVRQSFAAYYYTKEAPAGWDGTQHSTVFRARPNEKLRRYVMMPAEALGQDMYKRARQTKRLIKRWLEQR